MPSKGNRRVWQSAWGYLPLGGLQDADENSPPSFISVSNRSARSGRARIRGNSVVVTSDAVPQPVAVRYGWANVPDGNLFNKAGLPASPFRTDGD